MSLLLFLPVGPPLVGPTTLEHSVFGPRIGSLDIERAVIATLTERLPTYLDHCARLRGIDPATVGFPIRPKQPPFARKDFGGWPEKHVPCVQVVCPGMAERPVKQEDGLLTTYWTIEVYAIVSARDHNSTRLVRSVYEDAIGLCLMQHKSLGGLCTALDLLGESSADVPVEEHDNRTLQGTVVVLSAEIPDCLDVNAGPAVFIPDDGVTAPGVYPDDPEATDVTFTLTPEALP